MRKGVWSVNFLKQTIKSRRIHSKVMHDYDDYAYNGIYKYLSNWESPIPFEKFNTHYLLIMILNYNE